MTGRKPHQILAGHHHAACQDRIESNGTCRSFGLTVEEVEARQSAAICTRTWLDFAICEHWQSSLIVTQRVRNRIFIPGGF